VKVAGGSPALSAGDPPLSKRLETHFTAKLVREIGFMVTGGSSSIPDLWVVLREAGALARETLRASAARHWKIDIAECSVSAGRVVRKDGESMNFGAIVALGRDAIERVSEVSLKAPGDWTLIGTPAKRVEAIDKVTGTAKFAADIHEPGMLYAEVALCPLAGGTLSTFDEAVVRSMPGVIDVVVMPSVAGAPAAIGVIADQRWRARRAVDALNAPSINL
jgi:isoquinoline 1-oxidoreductase beta subunit